jgi:superfamily II DNA or RNA helicase
MNTATVKMPETMNRRCEIRLAPSGILHLERGNEIDSLQKTFKLDWRAGWFSLAASKLRVDTFPSLHFWQGLVEKFLTELCHLSAEEEFKYIDAPAADQLSEWIIKAPPMEGGEYLSLSSLRGLWDQLNKWISEQVQIHGNIHSFLEKKAPKWKQVGRVCFHLAENKKDPSRPFAFLATYSTSMSQEGKIKHLPLKKALEQYSGDNNRQALIKLLTPIRNAAVKCSWLNKMLDSGEVYQPSAWTSDKAHHFLCSLPALEESGLSVRVPNWWKKRSRPQVSVTLDTPQKSFLNLNAMLSFDVQIALGDEKLSKEELEELLKTPSGLAYMRGQWVEVDREKLEEALDHWNAIQKQCSDGEISFVEGMRLLAGAPSGLESGEISEDENQWVHVSAGNTLGKILQDLRDPSQMAPEQALASLNATLRPYQKEGVSWLSLLSGLGLGACLADDMGLGKTIQILSLLLVQKERRPGPSLLVVPASLLGNWRCEADRFTPSLKLAFVHPSESSTPELNAFAKDPAKAFKNIDFVITTYSMVSRQAWLTDVTWNLLVLDEAQAIKNSGTKQSRSIKKLKAHARIALTGTPIENRLSDLWSLFDFLNPGLLGSALRFKKYIKSIQESSGQFESLRRLINPYILRRMKTDPSIISDLPNKIETPSYCCLSKEQIHHYQSAVKQLKKDLEDGDEKARRAVVLQTLLRLKQICNHPSHFSGDHDYTPSHSGKFTRLTEICEELASRQEKVLIFTQFSEIIPHIAEHLSSIFGKPGLTLHGGTPIKHRKDLVERFQSEDGPPFFVLSLKAGGTGLTLTAASHVIHFDRWWNPAVENQATDRAFRIGQKKQVQVHKFITQGTVEEQIDAIISSKTKLANDVLGTSDEPAITELSDEELLNLVALDINRASFN